MKWRTLSVKVRGDGLQTRSRTGFYVGPATEKTNTAELVNAMDAPWDYTGIPMMVRWSGPPTPGDKNTKKVPFQISVRAGSVDLSGHHLQVEYAASIKGYDGKVVTRWGETMEGNVTPEQEQQITTGGMNYRNSLTIAPGKYLVRFVVRDDTTGHIGSVQAPLELN